MKKTLLLCALVFVVWTGAANAAVRTSTATGGNWTTGSTWVGGVAPGNTDSAIIATTGGNSVTIGANITNAGITVNSGAILTINGTSIVTENGNVVVDGTVNGSSGTIRMNSSGKSLDGVGTINSIILANQNFSFLTTANLTINNNINSAGRTVTNNGTVNLNGNYARTSGTAIWTQGTNSNLNISGTFTPSASVTLNAAGAGNTINYNGGAQAIEPATYVNLIFSGSGAKSMVAGTSASGNLSIAPTGSATASIAAGQTLTVNTLTLGGVGTVSGTWGSTASTATNKNDVYFAATTGRLSVTVSTANPTPTTTSISPTSATEGGSQFTLTVNGTNFISSSVVNWNGSSRTTTFVSATQLTATILASDVATAGTASVTVFSPTPGGGTSNAQTFTITAIAPTKFVILPPTSGSVDAPIVVTVQAQNNAGVVATSYQQDVTLLKSGSATGGGLINIVNGVGTTTVSDTVAETVHLTLSDTQGTGLNVSSAQDVIFSAGATSQLSSTGPGVMTAGTRGLFTVTRKDQYNNLRTTGSESYYLYSDSTGAAKRFYDAASGGNIVTTVTIQNGSSAANFWYYDELAGAHTVSVSDNATAPDGVTGIRDTTSSVTVTAATAAQFSLNTQTSMTAGTRLNYTVTRKDSFGNVTTLGTSTAYLYSNSSGSAKKFYDAASAGNIITSLSIGEGASVANFWYYDELATNATVTVSDNATAPDGNTGIIDAASTITIVPAAVGQFVLNNPGDMTAGTRLGYTVTRKDSFGNLVTTGSSVVYLFSNSTGGTKAFYDAASAGNVITSLTVGSGASTASFWYFDEQVGTWTITTSDNIAGPDGATGIADGTDSVTVNAAPIIATRITIVQPTNGTVGDTIAVSVRAEDNSGNLDTTYNNGTDITLRTSGSATPQNGVVLNIQNGVGSTNITDTVAETVTVSLTGNASTTLDVSSTKTVTFAVGGTAQFTLNNPGNATAGTRLGYTVTRKDSFGNLVTTGADTVHLYSNATGGLSTFYDAASAGNVITSVTIQNGASAANFWYSEGKSGTWTVTVSDNATTPDGASGIADASRSPVISPAAVSQFTIDNPGDMMSGTRLGYTVTRKDSFGNLVTSGSTILYMYTSANSTSSAFYDAASNGNRITSRTIGSGASTASFWYYEEKAGTWTVTASDNGSTPDGTVGIADASVSVTVSSVPIVATRFTILRPSDVVVGGNTIVTIRAEDNSGNVDTTINSSITLAISGSATGGGVVNIASGIGTKTISDTVAETVILSLQNTASSSLDFSSIQSVNFSAQPIITAGGSQVVSGPVYSTVVFSGTAFPGAKLNIIGTANGDVPIRQGTTARADGTFTIRFGGLTPGIRSYFLSVADKDGHLTQTKVYTLNVNQELVVRNVFLPPTIGFAQRAVLKGGFLGIKGFAMPGAMIGASIDGKDVLQTVTADDSGEYLLPFNTIDLALGTHAARVTQINTDGEKSDSSIERTFLVTNLFVPQTDLNGDGVINASDLSIFLAKWLSGDATTRKSLDFNSDGTVDIQDLSIFARTLGR